MANTVEVYKPEDVVVTINSLEVTDLSMATPVAVAFDEAKVTKTQDRQNGGIYNVRATQGGTITLSVMGHSHWNALLSNLSLVGGTFAIMVADKNDYSNRVKFVCQKAMVQGLPSYSYDEEIQNVEYTIECIYLELINVNPESFAGYEAIFG